MLGASVAIDERLPDAVNKALDKEVTPDRSLFSGGGAVRATKPEVSHMIVGFP
jgi:hypothetical protein